MSDTGPARNDTARLQTFSDGVFAIAITLLALEIDIPPASERGGASLTLALRELWPSFAAYAVSFLQIGVMWANHHNRFKVIRRSDHALIVLNTLLLMCVAFLPVATGVLADHVRGSSGDVRAATVLYTGTLAASAAVFTALWLWASRNKRLVDEAVDAAALRTMDRRYVAGLLLYLAAMALSPFWPSVALTLVTALALRFLFPEPAV
ncbi:MAG: TMEM175 family protein [Actinomycetota bacterium]